MLMTYPMELRENTRLTHKIYPFQLFHNKFLHVKPGDNVLYLHWHEHFEIIIMRQGCALFHIDSQPYQANPGDVLIVPSGGLHVGYALHGGDIYYECLVFNGSLFSDWANDPVHAQYVLPYIDGRLRFPVKPADKHAACTAYYSLIDEAVEELTAKRAAYELIVKAKLHTLFTLLSRSFIPQQQVIAPIESYFLHRDRFKPLIQHIEENVGEKMTIEQAARRVNLNHFHFCKLFKKMTGRTFVEYVNVCRMNEAERLLHDTDNSITDIASHVGCDNPNYFTKLYKQYKGMTPSQARKHKRLEPSPKQ